MKLIRHVRIIILMGVITMGIFGCSSKVNQYSPEQVINNALAEANLSEAYYAEIEMTTRDKGEDPTQSILKEWRSKDGEARVELGNIDGSDTSIAVNDGKVFITYQVEKNQAISIDDPELLAFNQPSPKEQANSLLDMIRDTHDIQIEGEEEIAGRATYHLVAKANESNTLFGDQEMWIDQEHWLVLKSLSNIGDSQAETIYTKVDFGVKIPSNMFTLDLPDDVQIKNLEDLSEMSEVTLEEATESIGKPILHFPENKDLQISTIEMNELKGEIDRIEVNIDYIQDDLPLLTLAVFESPEADLVEGIPGEEAVTIRNQEGSFMEMGDFRSLLWEEDGINYSIIIIDPNLTLEELKKMTEDMEITE